MAKCIRCGKHGILLKLNADGHCKSCQPTVQKELALQREKEAKAFADKLETSRSELSALQAEIVNKEKLLADAKEAIKGAAQRQLESDFIELQKEYASLYELMAEKQIKCNDLESRLGEVDRKLITAANRLMKAGPLFNSMKHAMNTFASAKVDDHVNAQLFDIESIDSIVPPIALNCLTMKNLRSLYGKNEKQIVEVYKSYQGRYTTKANATIYKLMVLALESELRNILQTLKFGSLDTAVDRVNTLTAKYYTIATDGNQSIAPTMQRFIGQIESLYTEAVKIEYEYYVQRENAKEEQRALKEQMRQEAEERKQLEIERKRIENEEKKYQTEIERITDRLASAHESELDALKAQLALLELQLESVIDKKEEIINLQNGKAGTVYVISNIGSFGEQMFKIGMTRRLEPQDRINELSNASVPFPFDIHSFMFSEDAVSLENTLHSELNDRRVNKINRRKEFFSISSEELQALVERIDPTAPFRITALAEQYRQGLEMGFVRPYTVDDDEDDCDDEPDA